MEVSSPVICTAETCRKARDEAVAPKKTSKAEDQDHAMLIGLGCLTAICGALLVVSATISAIVWLARWALGW